MCLQISLRCGMRVMSLLDRIEKYKSLHTSPITPVNITFDHRKFIEEYSPYESKETIYEGTGNGSSNCLTSMDGEYIGNKPELGHPHKKKYNFLKSNKPTEIFRLPSIKHVSEMFDYGRSVITTLRPQGYFPKHRDVYVPNMLKLLAITSESKDYILRMENKRITIEPGQFYLIDSTIVHEVFALEKVHQFIVVIRFNDKNINLLRL